MKEIIIMTSVVVVVFLMTLPSQACSQKETELMTGGACSISELQNLEKNKLKKEDSDLSQKEGRNLRPVAIKPDSSTLEEYNKGCFFGNCLYKILLGQ